MPSKSLFKNNIHQQLSPALYTYIEARSAYWKPVLHKFRAVTRVKGHLLDELLLFNFGTGPTHPPRLMTVYISRAVVFVVLCIGLEINEN